MNRTEIERYKLEIGEALDVLCDTEASGQQLIDARKKVERAIEQWTNLTIRDSIDFEDWL